MLNPGRAAVRQSLPGAANARWLVARGRRTEAGADGTDVVHLDGFGYAVLDLACA